MSEVALLAGVVAAFFGSIVSVSTLLQPVLKLHSRLDLIAYRLEMLEEQVRIQSKEEKA